MVNRFNVVESVDERRAYRKVIFYSPLKIPEAAPPLVGKKGGFPNNVCYIK